MSRQTVLKVPELYTTILNIQKLREYSFRALPKESERTSLLPGGTGELWQKVSDGQDP